MSVPGLEADFEVDFNFSQKPFRGKPPVGYEDWICYRDIAAKYALGFMTVKHMWKAFGTAVIGDDGKTRWFNPERVDSVMRQRVEQKLRAQMLRHGGPRPRPRGLPDIAGSEAMRLIKSAVPMSPIQRPGAQPVSLPAAPHPSVAPTALPRPATVPAMSLPRPPAVTVPAQALSPSPAASGPVVVSSEASQPGSNLSAVVEPSKVPGETEGEIDAGMIRCCWQESFDRGVDVRVIIVEQLACTWDDAAELFKRWVHARQDEAVDDLFSGEIASVPLLERGDIAALNDLIEKSFSVDKETAHQFFASWMMSPGGAPFRRRMSREKELRAQAGIANRKLKTEMEAAEKQARRELERDTRALARSWKESEEESARFDREQIALREKGQKAEADRRVARRAEQQARQAKPGPFVSSIEQAYPGIRDMLIEVWKKKD